MKNLILGYHKLRIAKADKKEIEKFLINNRIQQDKIEKFIETYDIGFKSGINHVVTHGQSSKKIKFGENPIFDSAFNMGRHLFKTETSFFYKYRMIIFSVLTGFILLITII